MSSTLSIIRIWAAAAWADKALAGSERQVLARLIDRAGLDEADRKTALTFLESPVELDGAPLQLPESERAAVYRSACRLAGIDLHVADEERSFLTRLRAVLALDDATAGDIEKSAGFRG